MSAVNEEHWGNVSPEDALDRVERINQDMEILMDDVKELKMRLSKAEETIAQQGKMIENQTLEIESLFSILDGMEECY